MANSAREFYERVYQSDAYVSAHSPEAHSGYTQLRNFIERYKLQDKRCLEVGTGRGAFQNLVRDYIGIDIATSAGKYIDAPFAAASANALPFLSHSFDAIWAITVLVGRL